MINFISLTLEESLPEQRVIALFTQASDLLFVMMVDKGFNCFNCGEYRLAKELADVQITGFDSVIYPRVRVVAVSARQCAKDRMIRVGKQ